MQINDKSKINFTNLKGKRKSVTLGSITALKDTDAATVCHGHHKGIDVNSPVKIDMTEIGHPGMLAIFGDNSNIDSQVPAIMSISAFATLSTVGVKKYGSATIKA